jgi:GNAT superfamily N-acetyltransferase
MHDMPVIRPLRPEDWPAIEAMIKRIWAIGVDFLREQTYGFQVAGKPWHERKAPAVRQELYDQAAHSFVTEIDGQVIGFCCLHLDPSTGIGEVGHNGVHPDYRGKGYGARQLRFILGELRRQGMRIAEVQTALNEGHAPARRMYEGAGFKPLIAFQRYYLDLESFDEQTHGG